MNREFVKAFDDNRDVIKNEIENLKEKEGWSSSSISYMDLFKITFKHMDIDLDNIIAIDSNDYAGEKAFIFRENGDWFPDASDHWIVLLYYCSCPVCDDIKCALYGEKPVEDLMAICLYMVQKAKKIGDILEAL